ncbi:MAG: YciI family protein [Nakamurella sp.]
MTRYLLSIYQPEGQPPGPEFINEVAADLHELNTELKRAGAWVFTGGLHGPAASTVVRGGKRDTVITDGPYLEGKEHIGGFWIIDAPDLDAALSWAEKAARATTLPIEVRPFQNVPDY